MTRAALFRFCLLLASATALTAMLPAAEPLGAEAGAAPRAAAAPQVIRSLYTAALLQGRAYDDLRALVANYPGRIPGSDALENATLWAQETLGRLKLDKVYTQPVRVPHWVRGEPESVLLVGGGGVSPLTAAALGGSGASPAGGVLADVIEVHSLDEVAQLGAKVQGKVVFFNRPMDPTIIFPMTAYSGAVDQRTIGPAAAAKFGAVAALVRSMTLNHDDVVHTGVTLFPAGATAIPAAALSTLAADRLSAAITEARQSGSTVRVSVEIHARTLPDVSTHNVIGEIRGAEFPDQVIAVGGHLDCWDIAPGAHDDGSGIVQAMEVLRLFRILGLKPRHTIRCVLFVNEEISGTGGRTYAQQAKASGEKHLLALESDSGGFDPRAISLSAPALASAARWQPLFAPYAIQLREGSGGADVAPLGLQGVPLGELYTDSQRYFDVHHSRQDTFDTVNRRELELGAAAMASLIWLVDTEGL